MWNAYKKALKIQFSRSIIFSIIYSIWWLAFIVSCVYVYAVYDPIWAIYFFLRALPIALIMLAFPLILPASEVITHRKAILKLPYADESDVFSEAFSRTLNLKIPIDEAFIKCIKISQAAFPNDLTTPNQEKNTIQIINYGTRKKPQSTIEIKLKGISDDETGIEINSKSAHPNSFLDRGKKLRNLELVSRLVKVDDLNKPETQELISEYHKFEQLSPFHRILMVVLMVAALLWITYAVYIAYLNNEEDKRIRKNWKSVEETRLSLLD